MTRLIAAMLAVTVAGPAMAGPAMMRTAPMCSTHQAALDIDEAVAKDDYTTSKRIMDRGDCFTYHPGHPPLHYFVDVWLEDGTALLQISDGEGHVAAVWVPWWALDD